MKKHFLLGSIVILVGLVLYTTGYRAARADLVEEDAAYTRSTSDQVATPTLRPTTEPIFIGSPTPETRVLPPVGSNAGLVIGASVLVLIIIGGVLTSRLRRKH